MSSRITQRDLTQQEIAHIRASQPGIDLLLTEGGNRITSAHNNVRGLILISSGEDVTGVALEGGTREERIALTRKVIHSIAEQTGGQIV